MAKCKMWTPPFYNPYEQPRQQTPSLIEQLMAFEQWQAKQTAKAEAKKGPDKGKKDEPKTGSPLDAALMLIMLTPVIGPLYVWLTAYSFSKALEMIHAIPH